MNKQELIPPKPTDANMVTNVTLPTRSFREVVRAAVFSHLSPPSLCGLTLAVERQFFGSEKGNSNH